MTNPDDPKLATLAAPEERNSTVGRPGGPVEPRLNHVQCLDNRGLHRMAYWEWGDAANPRVLVCVHGLTRQGRDFDTLALALQTDYRVVCPDVVGRGRSDWLADPMSYAVPQYVADMVTLLARLDAQTIDWVGTSMGGLIGLGVAALKQATGRPEPAGSPSGGGRRKAATLGAQCRRRAAPSLRAPPRGAGAARRRPWGLTTRFAVAPIRHQRCWPDDRAGGDCAHRRLRRTNRPMGHPG